MRAIIFSNFLSEWKKCFLMEGGRKGEREKNTDLQRDTEWHNQRETEGERQRCSERQRAKEREPERKTETHTHRKTEWQRDKEKKRLRDKETEIQRDQETERQLAFFLLPFFPHLRLTMHLNYAEKHLNEGPGDFSAAEIDDHIITVNHDSIVVDFFAVQDTASDTSDCRVSSFELWWTSSVWNTSSKMKDECVMGWDWSWERHGQKTRTNR